MEWFSDPQIWIAVLILTAFEIVVGYPAAAFYLDLLSVRSRDNFAFFTSAA